MSVQKKARTWRRAAIACPLQFADESCCAPEFERCVNIEPTQPSTRPPISPALDVATQMRVHRLTLRWSVSQVSSLSLVSSDDILKYESHQRNMTAKAAMALQRALCIDILPN